MTSGASNWADRRLTSSITGGVDQTSGQGRLAHISPDTCRTIKHLKPHLMSLTSAPACPPSAADTNTCSTHTKKHLHIWKTTQGMLFGRKPPACLPSLLLFFSIFMYYSLHLQKRIPTAMIMSICCCWNDMVKTNSPCAFFTCCTQTGSR